MSKIRACTQFINVMVKVKPSDAPGKYHVHVAPEIPCVTEPDTVINYQIYDTDGFDIVFSGATITPQNDQLSDYTISVSKKILTLSDANTREMPINVTLHFTDPDGVEFSHDPQIQNDPRPK